VILVALAAVGGIGLVVSNSWAMREQVRDLKSQLSETQSALKSQTTQIEAALSPLAVNHARAVQARLKAGDKAGAKAQLEQARALALSVRDLGTGKPPSQLVVALTSAEKALGEKVTLTPAPSMGGT